MMTLSEDQSTLLRLLTSFPQQCRERIRNFEYDLSLPFERDALQNIIVTGMGGSAIGGDILRTYLSDYLNLPMIVNRDYTLPGFVNAASLVFAVSYSGSTEETLSAFRQALKAGAKIIAITSGGELEKESLERGIPLVSIPPGRPPRTALGHLFISLLLILERLAFIPPQREFLDGTISLLEKLAQTYSPENASSTNLSRRVADELFEKIPIIYGSPFTEAIALRWKTQLHENSKVLAFCNVIPEQNHNEVEGWQQLADFAHQLSVIFLRDKEERKEVQKRIEMTKSLIAKAGVKSTDVESQGTSRLERIFSLIYLGDFTSFYLALLRDVNPMTTPMLDRFKRELASFLALS